MKNKTRREKTETRKNNYGIIIMYKTELPKMPPLIADVVPMKNHVRLDPHKAPETAYSIIPGLPLYALATVIRVL